MNMLNNDDNDGYDDDGKNRYDNSYDDDYNDDIILTFPKQSFGYWVVHSDSKKKTLKLFDNVWCGQSKITFLFKEA